MLFLPLLLKVARLAGTTQVPALFRRFSGVPCLKKTER